VYVHRRNSTRAIATGSIRSGLIHPSDPPPSKGPHRLTLQVMNSDGRSRRRELVEEAYNLQVKAGLMARRIFHSTVLSTSILS